MTDDPPTASPPRSGWELIAASARPHKRGFALGIGAGLLWSIAKIAVPLLVRAGVDEGLTASGDADGGVDLGPLATWAALIALAGVVSAVFTGTRRWLAFRQGRVIETEMRGRLFDHFMRLHFGAHDRLAAGELMSRATTDLLQVQNLLTMIPITFSNLVTVIGATIVMFVLDPWLAALALIGLPLANFFGRRFSSRLHPAVAGIARESAELAAVVDESVAGVRVVKGFGAESVMAGRLRVEADDVYREATAAAGVRATYMPAIELVPNIGLIVVLLVGGQRVIDGAMTVGELVAFNAYVVLLVWPLRSLGFIISNAQRGAASADRVAEILAIEPAIVDPPEPVPLPARQPGSGSVVRFTGVDFSYTSDSTVPPVLSGLDLTIEAGESLAIVGETGSGKTTIARLLARFYDVGSGSVTLDGVDVRDLELAELRRAVGIVFEETFLFDATIRDNIAFAEPSVSDLEVELAAEMAGAAEFVGELADGYGTEIGERGFSLSGGQRQRIAIARALVTDPRVLVLDDATSSVDPTKEHEIRDSLRQAMAGRTTIVIAHRPATVALADRVALVDAGRVVAIGRHVDLLASNQRYREVLATADQPDDGSGGGTAPSAVGGSIEPGGAA